MSNIPEQVNRLRAAQEIAAVVRRMGLDPTVARERIEAASAKPPAGEATWVLVGVLLEDRSEEDLVLAGLKRLSANLPKAEVSQ